MRKRPRHLARPSSFRREQQAAAVAVSSDSTGEDAVHPIVDLRLVIGLSEGRVTVTSSGQEENQSVSVPACLPEDRVKAEVEVEDGVAGSEEAVLVRLFQTTTQEAGLARLPRQLSAWSDYFVTTTLTTLLVVSSDRRRKYAPASTPARFQVARPAPVRRFAISPTSLPFTSNAESRALRPAGTA